MKCLKAQEWLSREMDGELSPSRKNKLDSHLAACPACRDVRERWAALRGQFQVREVPPGATAEAAWADVRRAIRTQRPDAGAPESRGWAGVGLRWAYAAAALVLLGVFGVVTLRKPAGPELAAAPEGGRVEWVETGLPGASPMVYEDIESGLVIIWVVEANHKELPHAGT